jgi:hypothetical protein
MLHVFVDVADADSEGCSDTSGLAVGVRDAGAVALWLAEGDPDWLAAERVVDWLGVIDELGDFEEETVLVNDGVCVGVLDWLAV